MNKVTLINHDLGLKYEGADLRSTIETASNEAHENPVMVVSKRQVIFTAACTLGFYCGNQSILTAKEVTEELLDHAVCDGDWEHYTPELLQEITDYYNTYISVANDEDTQVTEN